MPPPSWLVLAFLAVVSAARPAAADEAPVTTCRDLCPVGWPDANPCVVRRTVTIAPGSTLDCSDHDVEVTGGDLVVHDGDFALQARSLLVAHHTITADCPTDAVAKGFSLATSGDFTLGPGGGLRAPCPDEGGRITVDVGGTATLGGRGITVNGTGLNGHAGVVTVRAAGPLVTTAPIRASISNGFARGGEITLEGSTVTIGNSITAVGAAFLGQTIVVSATGDITITDRRASLTVRGLNASGGVIVLETDGTIRSARPLRAHGTSGAAAGGGVFMSAGRIVVEHDITVAGGGGGGQIILDALGRIDVGVDARRPVRLNATTGTTGFGGDIDLDSAGDDVTVGGRARIDAGNRSTAGGGGFVFLGGIAVTAAAGSLIAAEGTPDLTGEVDVIGRGAVALLGTIVTDDFILDYRCTTKPCEAPPLLGPGVTRNLEDIADRDLAPPCGDGIRRVASEPCDGSDLGGQTCVELGHAGGALACTDQCAFDTSGCF